MPIQKQCRIIVRCCYRHMADMWQYKKMKKLIRYLINAIDQMAAYKAKEYLLRHRK